MVAETKGREFQVTGNWFGNKTPKMLKLHSNQIIIKSIVGFPMRRGNSIMFTVSPGSGKRGRCEP